MKEKAERKKNSIFFASRN